jgi:hypothetical protein
MDALRLKTSEELDVELAEANARHLIASLRAEHRHEEADRLQARTFRPTLLTIIDGVPYGPD